MKEFISEGTNFILSTWPKVRRGQENVTELLPLKVYSLTLNLCTHNDKLDKSVTTDIHRFLSFPVSYPAGTSHLNDVELASL